MSPTVPCHVMVCRRRCVLCHAPCTCIVARLIPYKRVVACVRISGRVSASECQALGDKLLGAALMAFSAALFVYYTAWTVVTVRLSGIEAICIVMGVHRARLKGWLSRPLLLWRSPFCLPLTTCSAFSLTAGTPSQFPLGSSCCYWCSCPRSSCRCSGKPQPQRRQSSGDGCAGGFEKK